MSRIYQNHRALWLERMVKENNFSRGAEIGVLRGATYKHLLNNCPHLTLIGVDIFYDDTDISSLYSWLNMFHHMCLLIRMLNLLRTQKANFAIKMVVK